MYTHNGTPLPQNRPFTLGEKQYPANWLALAKQEDLDAAGISYAPDPPVVPTISTIVSMRQARLALLRAGLLDAVNGAIANMVGVPGVEARIEWEFATTVERNSPLVQNTAVALGLTETQLDELFKTASETI